MTRILTFGFLFLFSSCLVGRGDTPQAATPAIVWEVAEGIQTPESVCYDPTSKVLFVSNIGTGGPTGKDGDGFISQLGLDGKVLALKWVTGLDAPKGMRLPNTSRRYCSPLPRLRAWRAGCRWVRIWTWPTR